MNPSWEAIVNGVCLLGAMAAYALFSGADFGGGIWDMVAGSPERGEKPRAAIDASVTPVWEGNHVWIIFVLVILWTAFPPAFAAVMTTLFVPLSLSLLGIFFRGVGFAFRHEAERLRTKQLTGALFAASSFMAPFFLGTAVGAVATGKVRAGAPGDPFGAWISPATLMTGVLFVSACAYIGAVYLIGDSARRGDEELVRYFSRRGVLSGITTGLFAAVNMLLLHRYGRYIFDRLMGIALPLVLLSVLSGLAALVLILLRKPRALRVPAALAVASVIAAWGLAQYPWLLPRTMSIQAGSAPTAALQAELAVMVLAAIFVLPSFLYLYWLHQHDQLAESESTDELREAVAAENAADSGGPSSRGRPHPILAGVLVASAVTDLMRDAFGRGRRTNGQHRG